MDVLSLIVACFSVAVALPSAMLAWHDLRLRRRADPAAQQPPPAPASNPPHGSPWPPPPSPQPTPTPFPAPVPSWWTAPPAAAPPPPFGSPMPLGRRVLAYYIDMFAPMLPLGLVHGLTSQPDGSSAAVDALGYNTALGNALSFVYIGLAILNLAWSSRSGRSFGKVVLGGRTLDAGTGLPLGWGRTVGRNALLLVPFLSFSALLRRDRRGVHDLVCGATVLRSTAGAAVQQWAPAYPQLQWASPPSSTGSQHF